MDIFKFEHLLKSSCLYFTRADILENQDRREGSLTNRMQDFFDHDLFSSRFVQSLKRSGVDTFGLKTKIQGRPTLEIRDELRKRARLHYRYVIKRTYISCWHINNSENYLMWRSYINDPPGIAIRSSLNSLLNALKSEPNEVFAIPIDYVSHSTAKLSPERLPGGMSQIALDMLTKKALPFSGETELRLITDILQKEEKWAPNLIGSHIDASRENEKNHYLANIDIESLVEAIVISPGGDNDFRQKIEEMINRQGLSKSLIDKIIPSTLT